MGLDARTDAGAACSGEVGSIQGTVMARHAQVQSRRERISRVPPAAGSNRTIARRIHSGIRRAFASVPGCAQQPRLRPQTVSSFVWHR
jgi:hypothetical protein